MRLHRITRVGLAELRRRLAAGDELTGIAQQAEDYWSEPHPADVDISNLAQKVPAWGTNAESDADNAVDSHKLLPIPRRVAADTMVWPWLAGVQFAQHTQARWSGDEGRFNARRIGTDVRPNAFGRLWWTAELSHVENPRALCEALDLAPSEDPYHFTRLLLRNLGLHQELTYRNELSDRAKLIGFLAFAHHEHLVFAEARDAAKGLNLLFSTTVVEGFERAGSEAGRHYVDPNGCRKLLDYLRARLPESEDEPTDPTPVREPSSGGLFSWLRGGRPRGRS